MRKATKVTAGVRRRAKKIRVLLMDVDGTLTNGDVCLLSMPDGSAEELKIFNAHDGAGLVLAHIVGLKTGLITGRKSAAMERRARDMKLDYVFQGQPRKVAAYEEILREAGATDEEVAYVGDDLPDLPLLARAGLAVAVGNAVEEVKYAAHYVTSRDGGNGALREVVELILKAQGRWKEAIPKALA